jgi:hypothetical protein
MMRSEVEELVMATKPNLLKEAILTLKSLQRLNFHIDKESDLPAYRAFKRINRVLNKAAKKAA